MILDRKLFASAAETAGRVMIEQVAVGAGYTAVTTSDGGLGIAATGVDRSGRQRGAASAAGYAGRPALDLLAGIEASNPMLRTMALALINAINQTRAGQFPEDAGNRILFDRFDIVGSRRVAMVGYFPPLVRYLEQERIPLSVIDDARGIGDKKAFNRQLEDWAEVLLLTATTIVNSTMEDLLRHAGPQLKTAVLGPSTPMLPEAFSHLPVHMLAGSAITDRAAALRIIRQGGGTRELKAFSRKVYWCADGGDTSR